MKYITDHTRLSRASPSLPRVGLVAAIVALMLSIITTFSASATDEVNRAAVVIHFGEGDVRVALVEFTEPEITGIELLERSGFEIVVNPFGGLGAGICAIEDVGCPATNCFCESFSSPSYFWQYFEPTQHGWQTRVIGAASRTVRDGDIDGWSWTDREAGLPMLTLDEIEQRVTSESDDDARQESPATSESSDEKTSRHSECPADVRKGPGEASVDPASTPVVVSAPIVESDSSSGPPASYAGFVGILVTVIAVVVWRRVPVRRRDPT
jgi:hypothetical protein